MDLLKENEESLMKGAGTILRGALKFRSGESLAEAGEAIQQAKRVTAASLRRTAGQKRATAQREAGDVAQVTELLQSRFQAIAAASGAGATGPGIEALQGRIAAEGRYRQLASIFEGEELARGLEDLANLRDFEGSLALETGKVRKRSKQIAAVATILGDVASNSFFDKFGEDDEEIKLRLA